MISDGHPPPRALGTSHQPMRLVGGPRVFLDTLAYGHHRREMWVCPQIYDPKYRVLFEMSLRLQCSRKAVRVLLKDTLTLVTTVELVLVLVLNVEACLMELRFG